MSIPLFEVDRRNSCLLCLQIVDRRKNEDDSTFLDGEVDPTTATVSVLLRYLKIDVRRLRHFTLSPLSTCGSSEVNDLSSAVSLCCKCLGVTNALIELFQASESIRIQLDLCVQQLHEFIANGDTDYQGPVIRGNSEALVSANIAELRRIIFKKCSMKLRYSIPRVVVRKCNNPGNIRSDGQEKQFPGDNKKAIVTESDEVVKVALPSSFRDPSPKGKRVGCNLRLKRGRVGGKYEKVGKKWECVECGKQLSNLSSFRHHYNRIHVGIKGKQQPQQCFDCRKIFRCRAALETHRMVNHTMNYFSDCIPASVSEQQLESTLMSFVDLAPVQYDEVVGLTWKRCQFCRKRLRAASASNLRIHFLRCHFANIITHAGEHAEEDLGAEASGEERGQLLMETSVNKCTLQQRRLQKHQKSAHNCEYCGRTFAIHSYLRRHLITDHSYNFFKHRLPDGVSKQNFERGLTSMMKTLDPTLPAYHRYKVECSACGKCCRDGWHLRWHLLLCHFKAVSQNALALMTKTPAASDDGGDPLEAESTPVVAFIVDHGCKIEPVENDTGAGVEDIGVSDITISEPFRVKVELEPNNKFETEERENKNKNHLKIKKHKCTVCGKMFARPESLSTHYRRIHSGLRTMKQWELPAKCELCKNILANGQYLHRHQLQVHPIELLKDQLPSGVTKRELNAAVESVVGKVGQELARASAEEKLSFECPLCEKSQSKMSCLKIHVLDCHLENVVPKIVKIPVMPVAGSKKCAHCEKYPLGSGSNRQRHLMLEHALILYKDRLPPGTSGKDFEKAVGSVQQSKFKALPKGRNEPRAFAECTVCLKRMRKHGNEMRFHLLRCHLEEVVKNVVVVNMHSESDTNEETSPSAQNSTEDQEHELYQKTSSQKHRKRKYVNPNVVRDPKLKCPECGYTFGRKDHLNRHLINVHRKEIEMNNIPRLRKDIKLDPNLKCPQCQRTFGRKHHLSRHVREVHPEQRSGSSLYLDSLPNNSPMLLEHPVGEFSPVKTNNEFRTGALGVIQEIKTEIKEENSGELDVSQKSKYFPQGIKFEFENEDE